MTRRAVATRRPFRPLPGRDLAPSRPTRLWLTGLLLTLTLFSACGDKSTGDGERLVYRAPVHPRAMWVLEPATIGIGDVATLEVAVVTRPNHRVLPFATPQAVAGLWILEVETLPVKKEPNRWIHRTRVRIRPRETGRFDWPATPIEVEGDGVVETLTANGLTVEVVSVIPKYIGKLTPFGLPPQLVDATRGQPWMWAAGGASLTLGCLGLLWLARRESNRPRTSTVHRTPSVPPWQIALDAIDLSLSQADRDPIGACESASVAIRCYMDRRFGHAKRRVGDGTNPGTPIRTLTSTTEELERATPPFAATSRWPRFVGLLHRLDQFRFPAATRLDAREAIREVEAFVRDSIPNDVAQ